MTTVDNGHAVQHLRRFPGLADHHPGLVLPGGKGGRGRVATAFAFPGSARDPEPRGRGSPCPLAVKLGDCTRGRSFPTAAPKPRRCSAAVSCPLPTAPSRPHYLGLRGIPAPCVRDAAQTRALRTRTTRAAEPGCLPSAALAASWPLRFKVLPLRAAGLDLEAPETVPGQFQV